MRDREIRQANIKVGRAGMEQKTERVRLLKAKDLGPMILHWGWAGAVLAGVGAWFGLVALGVGAVIATTSARLSYNKFITAKKELCVPMGEDIKKQLKLDTLIPEACAKIGLGCTPELYAWSATKHGPSKLNRQTPGPIGTNYVVVPELYLNEATFMPLDTEETKAILLHEFAHIARQDSRTALLREWMATASVMTVVAGAFGSVVSTGAVLPLVGSIAAAFVLDCSEIVAKKSWARVTEDWADRGAVQLGADPLRIIRFIRRHRPFWAQEIMGGSLEERFKAAACELLMEHPRDDKRYAKLVSYAKSAGRSGEDIDDALYGAGGSHGFYMTLLVRAAFSEGFSQPTQPQAKEALKNKAEPK